MKLTDEKVAKALGWRRCRAKPVPGFKKCKDWNAPGQKDNCRPLPPFTTSLDAIVAEVEARGEVCQAWCQLWVIKEYANISIKITSPELWCRALLAYLKEKP